MIDEKLNVICEYCGNKFSVPKKDCKVEYTESLKTKEKDGIIAHCVCPKCAIVNVKVKRYKKIKIDEKVKRDIENCLQCGDGAFVLKTESGIQVLRVTENFMPK